MPNEWIEAEHALEYLGRADTIPHRTEGEAVLLDEVPSTARRVLDLGTGDGRLLELVLRHCTAAEGVAVDFSDTMLDRFAVRFAGRDGVQVVRHDLSNPLPDLGRFDVVVSSFAIHHLDHPRKRKLYEEVISLLAPGGVFCNLEHVSSPTPALHERFMSELGYALEDEDSSNQLLDVETQLGWLREIGFHNVDCLWKWREMALLCGVKPRGESSGQTS